MSLQRANAIIAELDDLRDEDWSHANSKRMTALLEELERFDDTLSPNVVPGRIYCEPYADGKAFYLITAVTKQTVTLRHVPYGDAWTLPHVESRGGRISLAEVTDNLRRRDAMKALLS